MIYKELMLKILPSKLLKLYGFAFQEFFGNIMKAKYGDDFIMPWKYGSHGDYKNDGCIKSSGTYFAVYGPEKADLDITLTSKKMESDLKGLLKAIDDNFWKIEMKEFIFVINYKLNDNLPAPLYSKSSLLENEYKIKISLWAQREIEEIFESLSDSKIKRIMQISYVDPNFDIDLSAEIIAEIIDSIIKLPNLKVKTDEPLIFINKIKFNNLNFANSSHLNTAYLSLSKLENILKDYKQYSDEEIGRKMINLYLEAKEKFLNSNDQFDYIFVKIYEHKGKNEPKLMKAIDGAKMVIMAKYFENCSIFESK